MSQGRRRSDRPRPWEKPLEVAPDLNPSHAQYQEIQSLVLEELRRLIVHLSQPFPIKTIYSEIIRVARELDPQAELYDEVTNGWTNTVDIIVSDIKLATRVSSHLVKTMPDTVMGSDRGTAKAVNKAVTFGLRTKVKVPKAVRTPFGTLVRGKLSSEEYIAALIDLEVKLWHPKSFPQCSGFHIEAPPYRNEPTICLHVPWQQRDVVLRKDANAELPLSYQMATIEEVENELPYGTTPLPEQPTVEADTSTSAYDDVIVKVEMEDDLMDGTDSKVDPVIPKTEVKAEFLDPANENNRTMDAVEQEADILGMNRQLRRQPRRPIPRRRYASPPPPSLVRDPRRAIIRQTDAASFMTTRKLRDNEWGPDARDPRIRRLTKKSEKTTSSGRGIWDPIRTVGGENSRQDEARGGAWMTDHAVRTRYLPRR